MFLCVFSKMSLVIFVQLFYIDGFAVFHDHMAWFDLWKMASKISAVLFMAMGIMGQPDLEAILKLPSWKGRSSVSSSALFLVPSGKIQMEIPDFTFQWQ